MARRLRWRRKPAAILEAGNPYAENITMSSDLTNGDDNDPAFYEEIHEPYEPLREDLHRYLEETPHGTFIRHPFGNHMIDDLDYCSRIHTWIDERAARADECFENQDWEGYLGCVDVSLQTEWFYKDKELFSDEQYWRLLGAVYQNQKFTHYSRDLFDELFRAERPGRENLMDEEERAVFARLPDEFVVYRGYSGDEWEAVPDGIAWTLDRREAVWYANWDREAENVRVIRAKVRKADVWAYLPSCGVLLPPEKVFATLDRRARNEKARAAWSDFIKKPFDIEAWLRKANGAA